MSVFLPETFSLTKEQNDRIEAIQQADATSVTVEQWRMSNRVLVTIVETYDGGWMQASRVIDPEGGVRTVRRDGSLG